MKRFHTYLNERQEDVDALELTSNPPKTRQELIERLNSSPNVTNNPLGMRAEGHFSAAISGRYGDIIIKYTKPNTTALDGCYHWLNLAQQRHPNKRPPNPKSSYPYVQFLHLFEQDHGYYALLPFYTDLHDQRQIKLPEIYQYMREFWSPDDLKGYYADSKSRTLIDLKDGVNEISYDIRMLALGKKREAPLLLAAADVLAQYDISEDFYEVVDDIVVLAREENLLTDVHVGNLMIGPQQQLIVTDPLSWREDQVWE